MIRVRVEQKKIELMEGFFVAVCNKCRKNVKNKVYVCKERDRSNKGISFERRQYLCTKCVKNLNEAKDIFHNENFD